MTCVVQPLCIIVKSKDEVKAFENYQVTDAAAPAPPPAAATAPPVSAPAAPPPAAPAMAAPATAVPADGRVLASPFAKKLAAEKGIDLRVCARLVRLTSSPYGKVKVR